MTSTGSDRWTRAVAIRSGANARGRGAFSETASEPRDPLAAAGPRCSSWSRDSSGLLGTVVGCGVQGGVADRGPRTGALGEGGRFVGGVEAAVACIDSSLSAATGGSRCLRKAIMLSRPSLVGISADPHTTKVSPLATDVPVSRGRRRVRDYSSSYNSGLVDCVLRMDRLWNYCAERL
jgi:hypothetical protein